MSLVCVSIMVTDVDTTLRDAHEARAGGADMVEFRIDECVEQHGVIDDALVGILRGVIADCPLPCIVTCRSAEEGGACTLPASERVSLIEALTAASSAPPTYVDVEWSLFSRSANAAQKVRLGVRHPGQVRETGTRLVLSVHDTSGRPGDLLRRVSAMSDEPACAVVKVAYRARSLHDSIELLELPRHIGKPAIALGMGEFGVMTRVLAPKFGAFLSFVSLRKETATAPGQPTLRELLDVYRSRDIRGGTSVYGVIGWPVAESWSPLVHNAGFAARGIDAVYVPLPVASYADAGATYQGFRAALLELIEHDRLDFRGASVTMPHKGRLARLAAEMGWSCDGATRATGAANTITVERDGVSVRSVRVANTDAAAVETLLRAELSRRGTGQLCVGIIGAGGMGSSAAYAALRAGASVTIFNRDVSRARTACERLGSFVREGASISAAGLHELAHASCDVFVQCTPLGMSGGEGERGSALPVHEMRSCPGDATLIETVYRPLRTPAIIAAEERGWHVIDGASVFVAQAEGQFHAWTGDAVPAGMYDKLVRTAAMLK